MAYSETEIKAFAEKDLRISKLAITKSLIEKLPLEEIYEVQKVTELSEKYIDYIYAERQSKCSTKGGQAGCVASDAKHQVNWEQIAIGLNLAIPNAENIKILSQIADEYKKAYKASANPKDILVHILNTFGKYPKSQSSVEKVVKSLTEI